MRHFTFRHQPPSPLRTAILGGLGAMLAVAAIGLTQDVAGLTMLFAPLGASCVLVFGVPASPLSQPVNVVLGHALAGVIGVGAHLALPDSVWIAAVAVGLAITGMAVFRVTHPPAGATALVSYASAQSAAFLAFPILSGAVALVLLGAAYHRLTGTTYPAKPPERA
jgi:CBS-domain-containing membrane protein